MAVWPIAQYEVMFSSRCVVLCCYLITVGSYALRYVAFRIRLKRNGMVKHQKDSSGTHLSRETMSTLIWHSKPSIQRPPKVKAEIQLSHSVCPSKNKLEHQ